MMWEKGGMAKTASETVIDLYQNNAAAWVELRAQTLFEKPWLDRFLARSPRNGATILDLGCGSGQPIAAYLIAAGKTLTGVDGAGALVARARAQFPDHRWVTADMRDLPPLGRFHGVIAWHSFFHLTPDDQRRMFGTFGRLCHPGAALMFTSGTSLGEKIGTFAGQPLYHGSLAAEEYSHLLQRHGFRVVDHVQEDPACGGATVWLAQKNGV